MQIDLDDPIALMLAASGALHAAGIPAIAYGGLVLAMYGEPRETRDADLAVTTVSAEAAKQALVVAGLNVVVAFADMRFGGSTVTRLTVVGGGQLNTVDLVTPRSPRFAEGVVTRALTGSLRGVDLQVVTPEDFVLLKVLSTRDRDLEDARSVVSALRGRLDDALLAAEAGRLAIEIPDHAVQARFASVTS